MTKICLGCKKEYDDSVEYCPDCLAKTKDNNSTGNVVFVIGLVFLTLFFTLNNYDVVFGSPNSTIIKKIVFTISLILIFWGATVRIETTFDSKLISKELYNDKVPLKKWMIRFLRYSLIFIIVGIIVYFVFKYGF